MRKSVFRNGVYMNVISVGNIMYCQECSTSHTIFDGSVSVTFVESKSQINPRVGTYIHIYMS